MQLYEYQIKQIFAKAGIPVLKGAVAYTPAEAVRVAKQLDCRHYIVKAQIPSYLRGKGEFVEGSMKHKTGLCKTHSIKALEREVKNMLFKHLKTPLTKDKAFEVKKVYIEQMAESIARYRLSMDVDLEEQKAYLTAQNISPNASNKKVIHQKLNLSRSTFSKTRALSIAAKLGVPRGLFKKMVKVLQGLYSVFKTYQVLSVNIDPLILTPDKKLYVMSGMIAFDPDADLPQIRALVDFEEETPNERKARINKCRYLKLEGNIGCIINGSGLGMATLDLFQMYGGKPACLYDLGSEPTKDMTANALKAVLSEPDIEGVLVNIFGGTTRCDVVAEGLVSAAREISVGIPIVVRLDGTNEQIASRILFESGLPFTVKKSMDEAVRIIINQVQEIM